MHALALRLCRNSSDADDLVQEVFLRALGSWEKFRGEADPCTWLYAIAVNAWRSRITRRGGNDRRTPALSQLMPWGESSVSAMAMPAPGARDAVQHGDAVARVQSAIVDLPEHWRLPLVLKDVFGMPTAEVATALGLAENTVKTRLHRARLALRKVMLEGVPQVAAPPPIFERSVCADLLRAKMDAMDRGGAAAGFGVPKAELCARCRAVFSEFDLVQGACAALAAGTMSAALRTRIQEAITALSRDAGTRVQKARRGRKPVRASTPR